MRGCRQTALSPDANTSRASAMLSISPSFDVGTGETIFKKEQFFRF